MEFAGKQKRSEQKNGEGDRNRQPPPTHTDKWDTLPKVPSRAEMGYLHLSFEYHKEALKVRVWQISDLLLPPPQLSMIHSIFVRAYFIPDKARKTVRHTEDVVMDWPELSGVETPKTGIQHIFTPSSFKFVSPLLYRAVSEAVVRERSLQLEVCMRQKRSHRTFLMAMVHLPLTTAVRRPIRQTYPLIPCMNITIPNNMRVYSAAQLQLESSKGSHSPSIRRVAAPDEEEAPPVTAREVDLEDVVSLSGEDFLRSHLSLCLDQDSDSEERRDDDGDDDDDNDDDDNDDRLREVQVTNGVGSGGSSTTTLNIPSSGDDDNNDDDDDDDAEDVPVVITDQQGSSVGSTSIDMSGMDSSGRPSSKKKIIPNELLKDVAVDMPAEETVVNMDLPLPPHRTSSASPSVSERTTHARRKIKAGGLETNSVSSATNASGMTAEQSVPQQDSVGGRSPAQRNIPRSPAVTTSRKKKIMVLPGEINMLPSGERTEASPRLPQHSPASSEASSPDRKAAQLSPMQDMAFPSPASRPETPCWDFYDWSEDLMEEPGVELNSRALEDSLAQLRDQGVGSLLSQSTEPVLPVDLADDFDSLTVDSKPTGKQ